MANLIRRREREPGSLVRGLDPLRMEPFQVLRDLFGWNPFQEMEPLGAWSERVFIPDVEFKETKNAYTFKADLPGVQEKDLEISVTGSRIQITGKREEEETREDDRYYAYERSYGSFTRSFTLPEGANADDVTAELKDGVLILRVAKRPEAQGRRIAVQSAHKQLEESKGKEKKQAT